MLIYKLFYSGVDVKNMRDIICKALRTVSGIL